MSDDLHGAEALDDAELEAELAHEGVQAFNALTAAMEDLGTRLVALDAALGAKVRGAERVAATAETAAQNAKQAAAEAHASAREERRSLALWASCLVACAVLAAGALGYHLGERAGEAVGQAAGYQVAGDEKAAASWANTPTGQLAYGLDKAGSLAALARCDRPGWKAESQGGRRVCLPYRDRDGQTWGWALP